MRRMLTWLVIVLFCAGTCVAGEAAIQLPNGEQINVIGVTKMYSTNGTNAWLILDYRTELPISNVDALTEEADRIWPYFQGTVEEEGMREALIRANGASTGAIIKTSKRFGTAYEQAADGTWSRAGD